MACDNCEKIQDDNQKVAYYRWGRANIGLIGCDEHLRSLIKFLNVSIEKAEADEDEQAKID